MKFLSLLAALLIEQMRPLRAGNPVHTAFERYAAMLELKLNAGGHHHGLIAWILAVGPWALLAVALYYLLHAVSPILGWA